MSNENEATGRRREGKKQDETKDYTPRYRIRREIDKMADALKRAIDGMARDDETQINWAYVAGQLLATSEFLQRAVVEAVHESEMQDNRTRQF